MGYTSPRQGKKRALAQPFCAKAFLLFGIIFSLSDCRRQDFFHSPGRLLLRRCRDVGVGVQREACAEMSQHPGHRLNVHPILKCQHSERVPEVVESNSGQPRPLQHPVEYMQDAVW